MRRRTSFALPVRRAASFAARQGVSVAEYSLALEHAYTPFQLDSYRSVLVSHPRFLLYCGHDPRLEWIRDRLIRDGWTVRRLLGDPNARMYLYFVTR